MKLLKHEQDDLSKALQQAGTDECFHFVKRQGWVIVHHPKDRDDIFAFHRKKSVHLINGHFETQLSYTLKYKDQTEHCSIWPEVYRRFCAWLNL